jgi:hypothetical protein
MKKPCRLDEKLELLEPNDNTIVNYKEIETQSVERLKEFLSNGNDPKYNKIATQVLSTINKLRSTLKSQMAMRATIFKDISKDKKELNLYIKASFPHMVKK